MKIELATGLSVEFRYSTKEDVYKRMPISRLVTTVTLSTPLSTYIRETISSVKIEGTAEKGRIEALKKVFKAAKYSRETRTILWKKYFELQPLSK